MVVRTARNDFVAAFDEGFGHGLGILLHLRLVLLVFGCERFAESDGLGGDHVFERAALNAGEDGRVEQLRHLLDDAFGRGVAPRIVEILAHEDDASARAAQRLVRRRGDDMGVFHGVVQQAGGDQSGRVGHVDEQQRAHLVGDFAHTFVVPFARIGRGAADDELRTVFQRLAFHVFVVDRAGLLVELVPDGVEIHARHVDRRAVRQVSAVRKIEPHEGVARFENGEEDRHVGLCARMGLHIGVFGSVETADALDGQRLDLVHHLAAAVVAGGGIALGILVREYRAHGLHDLVADEVLRCDEFDAMRLTAALGGDQIENPGVSFHIAGIL